jgi:hypothetical protein
VKEVIISGIKLKQLVILFLLISVTGSSFNDLFSRNDQAKPTRQSSIEAFSKGNYEKAYSEFKELLLTYPKDPLYKYYSGVCLVKLNRNSGEALNLLQQALQGAAVVKTLPSDARFYLGRALQMSGKFTEAVDTYNLYADQVGKKAAREMGIPSFIQQCNEKKGEIPEGESRVAEEIKSDKAEASQKENLTTGEKVFPQTVKKEQDAKKNLPAEQQKMLNEAIVFQFKADSLISLAAEQKKELEKLPYEEKSGLKVKISENELLAASFQKSADMIYSRAEEALNPMQEKIVKKEPLQQSINIIDVDTVRHPVKKVINDPVITSGNKPVIETGKQSDTIKRFVPPVKKQVEIFSFFEVKTKPASDRGEKIEINPKVPEGLIYRIQVAVFRNPVAVSYFKGISPVYGFKIAGTDKTNYYAGMFRRSADAAKALNSVKSKGFRDAFVVALSGNKTISTDRSAILEKEWGKKPFITQEIVESETLLDTVPPTLSLRVEVLRSLKPLKEDIVEGIKKMAGNRGFDIQPLDDGNVAYLVGKFITFESAAEYADLMVRNGFREARVVAWLGKKEIPIETARQLFDNLK